MNKRQYISSFAEKTQVNDVFFAYDLNKRTNKNGSPYLTMMLRDKTGSVRAILWNYKDSEHSSLPGAEVYVRAKGVVGEYNQALQLRLLSVEQVGEDEIEPSEFLPVSTKDQDEQFGRLTTYVEKIQNEYLFKLLKSFFDDHEFAREFKRAPAAITVHHASLGGLLDHTLHVTRVAEALARIYSDVDEDLILAGAILHDVGKLHEYDYLTTFSFSTEGRLKGHFVMGCEMIRDRAAAIEGFPAELLMRLEHMILSHHGTREWGSPREPMFLEAELLHFADNIDTRHYIFTNAQAEPPGSEWSAHDKWLGHHVYLGKKDRDED